MAFELQQNGNHKPEGGAKLGIFSKLDSKVKTLFFFSSANEINFALNNNSFCFILLLNFTSHR
jgi:hypothetical protein